MYTHCSIPCYEALVDSSVKDGDNTLHDIDAERVSLHMLV